jgi:hypothetical protein
MLGMGMVSKVLGLGAELEFEGKKYVLAPWSYKIQGQFERYLEDEAYQVVLRLCRHLSPEEKKEQLAILARDIAAGTYSFGSEAVSKAMYSLKHFGKLLLLCLKPNHPEADEELVHKILQDGLETVMAKMAEANVDPSTAAGAPT